MKIPRFVSYSLLALAMLIVPASSFGGVVISVGIAPPALPVYAQPACPGDGYIWTPGYWAYGPDGYYWVPGTWVLAPEPGFLWTPGYWGWGGSAYIWHAGYWGPHVGFYGGINYGFGYFGSGYDGGYWHGREFFYNRSVNNVTITNVHIYNRTVVNHYGENRVSYNGGRGGIERRPDRDEERWAHERHVEATHMQIDHEHGARENREFLASVNHGHPAIAATARPGDFHGHDVAPARGESQIRHPEGRPMNREVPRPENSARNTNRGNMDRGNAGRPNVDRSNAGRANTPRPNNGRQAPVNEGPRPENRGGNHSDLAPHPTPSHAGNAGGRENAPRGNAAPRQSAPHQSAPRGNPAPRGNAEHGNEAHGNSPRGGNEGRDRH